MGRAGVMLSEADWVKLWWTAARDGAGLERCWRWRTFERGPTVGFRGVRDLVLLTLLGELGLRAQEVALCTWGDVGRFLSGQSTTVLPVTVAKGGVARLLVGSPVVLAVLERWRDVVSDGWLPGLACPLLAIRATQGAMSVRWVQMVCVRMGLRYLGRDVWPHDLRRTFGDRCRRAGDVRLAQLMLGHKRLSSTERYLGTDVAERLGVADRLAAQIVGGGGVVGAAVVADGAELGLGELIASG